MSNDKINPAPILSGEVAELRKLANEARSVFDSMLTGCALQEFGDYQNGEGETIGPRMDALHAALRALAAVPAMPAQVQQPTPQGFIDYVQANYHGTVEFAQPEWHADRLWRAAMFQLKNPPIATPAQPIADVSAASDERFADHYYDPLHLLKHIHSNIGWSGAVGRFITADPDLVKRILACINRAEKQAAAYSAAPVTSEVQFQDLGGNWSSQVICTDKGGV